MDIFSPNDFAPAGASFTTADLGFDFASRRALKLEASKIRPLEGETVIAYIDRVFNILDGYGRADRRDDVNRGIKRVSDYDNGMVPAPAPTRTVVRRPVGRDDHDIEYILDNLDRAIANIERAARERAIARERAAQYGPFGDGVVLDHQTDADRAELQRRRDNHTDRIIARMRIEIVKRAGLTGHARAPFTRSIRQDARTLIAKHGYTIENIVDHLNAD